MAGRLKGKVALVIGAGTWGPIPSNGRACALLFAREGASVFIVDAEAQVAGELAGMIRTAAPTVQVAAWGTDFSDPPQLVQMVAGCRQVFGRLDIAVVDMSALLPSGDDEPPLPPKAEAAENDAIADMARWSRSLLAERHGGGGQAAESTAPAPGIGILEILLEEVLWAMRSQRSGSVLVIPAVAGIHRQPPHVTWWPDETALLQLLCRVTQAERRHHIRANAVLPGLTRSPRLRRLLAGHHPRSTAAAGGGEEGIDTEAPLADLVLPPDLPFRRWNEPWDVAYAALFLVSDEARHISAQSLAVDDGLSCSA